MITNPNLAEKVNEIQRTMQGSVRQYGRLISRDNRDADYPMHLVLTMMPLRNAEPASSRYWDTGKVLNQGSTNHCVGFGMRSFLDAAPYKTHGGKDGNEIYYRATELDEFSGDHGEDGTSVRAGAKVLQEAGHIKQYVFAYDVETIARFLIEQGTVVVGTNWYAQMDNPQSNDGYLLHPVGGIVGGHCWHIIGVSRTERVFKMKQSWGDWWGIHGFAYIRFDDLQRLLAENGEAVAMLEQAYITAPVR